MGMDPIQRDRVVRRMVWESVLLAVLCGAGGLLLARWMMVYARDLAGR